MIDESAWRKGSKIDACTSGAMPMPVSATVNSTPSFVRADLHPDGTLRGELDRIGDQILEHDLQLSGVGVDARERRLEVPDEGEVRPAAHVLGFRVELNHEVLEGDLGELDRQPVGFQTAQVERRVDQVEQFPRVPADAPDGVLLVLGERAELAVSEEIVVADDDVERGAQLVGHRGDEVGLQAVGALELAEELAVGQRHGGELGDALADAFLLGSERSGPAVVTRGEDADDILAAPQRDIQARGDPMLQRQCGWQQALRSGHQGLDHVSLGEPLDQPRHRRLRDPERAQGLPLFRGVPHPATGLKTSSSGNDSQV